MNIINFLKKLPIDLGQGNLRKTTKGKLIAQSLVPDAGGERVALDVGCREGEQSKYLKSKGYKVVSIDIKKSIPECIIMDANQKLKFRDNYFDLIWCSEVIEHLNNPSFTITEFKRVLKPEGYLIITTPNSFFWILRLLSLIGLKPEQLQRQDHKHFFSKKDIIKLFPRAKILGFSPYFLIKLRITKLVGLLSPTFVIYEKK